VVSTYAQTLALALLAGGITVALGAAMACAPLGAALASLPLLLTGVMTGYLVAGAFDIHFLAGVAGSPAVTSSVSGALLRATAASELSAAGGLAVAAAGTGLMTNLVLLGGRARRAGIVTPPSG
jgi:hypothetical protein